MSEPEENAMAKIARLVATDPWAPALKAADAIDAMNAAKDGEIVRLRAVLEKVKGIRWRVCESEVLRNPSLPGPVRQILQELVDLNLDEKTSST